MCRTFANPEARAMVPAPVLHRAGADGRAQAAFGAGEAVAVLGGWARAQAKPGDGPGQVARMYKLVKGSTVKARTQAVNQLRNILVGTDLNLREEPAGLDNVELFRTCARFADDGNTDQPTGGDAVRPRVCGPSCRPSVPTAQLHLC
ncbi:hypothetical protein AB0D11_42565 [Streptomyces monashensis]|uniref:hypothetical protein n=1 Tax=Streptomyces monashensis TaxID=1678012 RepID=UPI0033D7E27A